MRVALVSDMYLPRRGGIELHVADLAARLAAAGHLVDVLTPTPPGGAGPAECPDFEVRRLAVPLLPGAGIGFTPALPSALGRAVAEGRYDVVHCHASVVSPAAWAGLEAAWRHGVPAVLTFHSMLRHSALLLGVAYRAAGLGGRPLRVTGVSTRVAEQAGRAAPGARVQVLPNGADVAWWAGTGAGRRARIRRDLAWGGAGWDDGAGAARPGGRELRLASAMRLTRKKRPDALVRIVARLCASAPDGVRVRLAVAGEGPMRPALEREIRRRGLGGAVRLLGWQSRAGLRALYHGADAFVLPTRDEAFGIAALEARAAGLPVVAWQGSGVSDFVDDGRHGYLCGSDDDMTERLLACARDTGTLADLTARSRAEPPAAYAWDAVVARHLAVYREAIDCSSATVPSGARPAARPASVAAGRRGAGR